MVTLQKLFTLSLLFGMFLTPKIYFSQTKKKDSIISSKYKKEIEISRQRIKMMIEQTKVLGFSVAVAKKGKIIWAEGFGKANIKKNVLVTKNSRFRLASVSKVVTTAVVARLVDKGLLNLDAPIKNYVDGLSAEVGGITTRQLAGHLGGIRHYQAKDFINNSIDSQNFKSVTESLKIFKDDSLLHSPGKEYTYSTFGYTLIAAVIEGASKKNFLEYLNSEVFQPLKMNESSADQTDTIIPNRVSFYSLKSDGTYKDAPFVNPSYKWAGGGLLSTPSDLVKFGSAHLNDNFISHKTLSEIFKSQKKQDGTKTNVGIGWRIHKGLFNNLIYHHEGSMQGARSAILLYPKEDLAIAFTSNLSGTPSAAFENAQFLAQPFLTKEKSINFKDYKLNGIFEIKGKTLNGKIEIVKTKDGFSGNVVINDINMPIVSIIPSKNSYQIILIHKIGGFMPLSIIKNKEGNFTGKFSKMPFDVIKQIKNQ